MESFTIFTSSAIVDHIILYYFQQQQQQQSFISCPEKFTVDKYMQREKLTIKKKSTAT